MWITLLLTVSGIRGSYWHLSRHQKLEYALWLLAIVTGALVFFSPCLFSLSLSHTHHLKNPLPTNSHYYYSMFPHCITLFLLLYKTNLVKHYHMSHTPQPWFFLTFFSFHQAFLLFLLLSSPFCHSQNL